MGQMLERVVFVHQLGGIVDCQHHREAKADTRDPCWKQMHCTRTPSRWPHLGHWQSQPVLRPL